MCGFLSVIFDYNSYRGIIEAANSLCELLGDLDYTGNAVLQNNPAVFVSHSMGGLVLRALCLSPDARRYIKKIVTLGTPHEGTLRSSVILDYYVTWGEYITKSTMPEYTGKKSRKTALELIGRDDQGNEIRTLYKLKNIDEEIQNIPILSISGGRKWLDIAKRNLINIFANRAIQKALSHETNDGLVAESSSDLTKVDFPALKPYAMHINDYADYEQINHTYLTENYNLALKIIRWINN